MEGFVILGPNLPYFEVESTTFRYDKKLNFIEETTEEQDVEDDEEDDPVAGRAGCAIVVVVPDEHDDEGDDPDGRGKQPQEDAHAKWYVQIREHDG